MHIIRVRCCPLKRSAKYVTNFIDLALAQGYVHAVSIDDRFLLSAIWFRSDSGDIFISARCTRLTWSPFALLLFGFTTFTIMCLRVVLELSFLPELLSWAIFIEDIYVPSICPLVWPVLSILCFCFSVTQFWLFRLLTACVWLDTFVCFSFLPQYEPFSSFRYGSTIFGSLFSVLHFLPCIYWLFFTTFWPLVCWVELTLQEFFVFSVIHWNRFSTFYFVVLRWKALADVDCVI